MVLFPTSVNQRPAQAGQPQANNNAPEVVVDEVSEENLRERRYLWTARAFAIVLVVSMVTNILMLMALFSLVPLTRVQPYELTFSDKNTQTVRITPLDVRPNVLRGITESMIRQYVTARHTITADPDEMGFRWSPDGIVGLLSTDNTYQAFAEDAPKVLDAAVAGQITREVVINSVIPYVSQNRGEYWNVAFDLITMSPQSATKQVEPYVATIYVTYEPYNSTWENRLKNPLGFKVTQYGSESKESFDAREREALKDKNR